MKYLGMDVHSHASVWCLLDDKGEEVGRGKTATVKEALQHLVVSMAAGNKLLVGQEVGTMSYYVHDAVTGVGPIRTSIAVFPVGSDKGHYVTWQPGLLPCPKSLLCPV